jgi:pimeloyl-ACP methyl ester carboxylesterase
VNLNGIDIHFIDEGEGPQTLVFSHGLLWSHHMFQPQIEALKTQYRCIAWDHRGQGQSAVPPSKIYTIEQNTEDAVRLLEHLNLGPVHFIGLSMGGFVGIRLAARRPDLIRSLTLIATAADPEPEANRPKYRRLSWGVRIFGVIDLLAKQVLPIMFGQTFLQDPDKAEVRARWVGHLKQNSRKIYRAVHGVIEREGVSHELEHIQAPTLVLRGTEDVAIAEHRSRALADGIRDAIFAAIPGAGHSATIEQPELVNAAIRAFLAERASEGSS